mgnify:CR=1 FL=1
MRREKVKMKRSFSAHWRERERRELGERGVAEIQGNCGVEEREENEEGREQKRRDEEEQVVRVESGEEREKRVLESVFVEEDGQDDDDGIQNGELLRETDRQHHRVVHVLVVVRERDQRTAVGREVDRRCDLSIAETVIEEEEIQIFLAASETTQRRRLYKSIEKTREETNERGIRTVDGVRVFLQLGRYGHLLDRPEAP